METGGTQQLPLGPRKTSPIAGDDKGSNLKAAAL